MRWRLGRDRGACTTCGAELDPDAVWCGACGAAAADARTPEETHPAEPPAPPGDSGDTGEEVGRAPRWHRFVRAVAIVAVIGLVVAVLRPTPPPEPLLGRVGALAGLSATGPPPDGLRVAWEAERPPGVVTGGFFGRGIVAADGRVRVNDVVVEVDRGRVVRRAAHPAGATRHRVEHSGDELVVVDTLTGEVTSRSPVEAPAGAHLVARARSGEVTLLTDAGRSFLVRDDGTVVAELDGTIAESDRAVDGPAAFPVRRGEGERDGQGERGDEVQLVGATTGEVVTTFRAPPGDLLAVDVVGDLALVATTSGQLSGADTPAVVSGPEVTGVPWEVELVDARTGRSQRQLVMQSAEPPRLLGFLDDGTTVLSTRSGREVAVRGIDPDGQFGPIAQLTTGVPSVIDAPSAGGSALLATVGVSGGVAVGLDVGRGLLGFSRRGNVLWQADAPDAEVLAAGDGYVAALPGDQGEQVRVVDATDGSVTATITQDDADLLVVTVPFAVLDGHVGMARTVPAAAPRMALGATTWLDLDTGELTGMHELFAPHAGGEPEDVGASWTLHGVVPTRSGGEPVITRRATRAVVQVLDPGGEEAGRFVTFELPGHVDDGVAAYVAEPVGASATRVALWTRDFEDPTAVATHVIDRPSDTVTTVPEVAGAAMVEDLLLAVELDQAFVVTGLLGIDADSGEQLWRSDGTGVVGSPGPPRMDRHRLDRDLMVTATALGIEAVSLRDGSLRWSHASDVELAGDRLVLGPRHVVAAATDGGLIALDRADGTVAWRTSLGVPVASITGAGEHTLVGTHDGLVVHLDQQGREVQRVAVGTDPVRGVAALGGTVVAVVGDAVVGLRADGTGITRDDEVDLP